MHTKIKVICVLHERVTESHEYEKEMTMQIHIITECFQEGTGNKLN
jgi:hypothetical protein